MAILDEIVAVKRAEVANLRQPRTRAGLRQAALGAPAPRDFAGALRGPAGLLTVIAEFKRRSPSKGDLAPDLDPATTAKAYEAGGAGALSVLTDRTFFDGSIDDLHAARSATDLPVLRKDFTIDEAQVYESRAEGADAFLLIVAALPDEALLAHLVSLSREVGIAALVEVHTDVELERALRAGAGIVGVNARDLNSFDEDLTVSEQLIAAVPSGVIAVAESAIRAPGDAKRMAEAGADAVLVGEALVRSEDPGALVRAMSEFPVRPRR